MDPIPSCLSVRQLAQRWRVAPAKVRALIRRGLLCAFDIGERRRQLRISPEAIAAFEQQRQVWTPPTPRRRQDLDIDPDIAALLE